MQPLDTRAVERDSLFMMAEVTAAGGGPAERVKVRNLSATGMMVESAWPAVQGERVSANLRNIGTVEGTVMWVSAPRCGIAFDKEIDPKLARTQVYGGAREAPVYARSALPPRRAASPDGKARPA